MQFLNPSLRSFAMIACLALSSATGWSTLQAAEPGPKPPVVWTPDPLMGNYEGAWNSQDGKLKVSAQIRSLGDGKYDGFAIIQKEQSTIATALLRTTGGDATGGYQITGEPVAAKKGEELQPKFELRARLKDRKLEGLLNGELGQGGFSAELVVKKPDSLGATPPAGAKVIFNGSDTSAFTSFPWTLVEGGAMQAGKGNIVAREKLADFKLHIEFRTPFMPTARGQARGNSGVYLQSIYEIQVLDSFGLHPLQINDCSSVYGVKTANSNASLPPLQWQTYDITFRQGGGNAANPPRITVIHNGVTVVDDAPVPAPLIGKGGGGGIPNGGFLMLQDHGDPVQYRNIWVQPL